MKAVFLDRDGVLVEDTHLLAREQDVRLMPGAAGFVASLRRAGFLVFIVSNQTVVSRGILSLPEAEALHQYILDQLRREDPEAVIDGSRICPHHPKAVAEDFRVLCDCRKPKPGMILELGRTHSVLLSKSFLVGDRITDVVAGNLAGVRSIHLMGAQSGSNPIESDLAWSAEQGEPWASVQTLREAAGLIAHAGGTP